MATKANFKQQVSRQKQTLAAALAQLLGAGCASGGGTCVADVAGERWRAKRRNLSPQQMEGEAG